MIWYFVGLFVMTLLGSVASLFLKKASVEDGILLMLKSKFLYIGGGLYFIAAILNILVLRVLDYSVVLPLTSLTYIWTMVLSYLVLNEKITKRKIIGIFFVLIGAIFVSMN